MRNGDRVKLSLQGFEESCFNSRIRGTAIRVSPFGYVRVQWDDGSFSSHSPFRAGSILLVVEGEDAMPRHKWTAFNDDGPCAVCGTPQSDENYSDACSGAALNL
jgi:hypothetical protein